MADQVAMAGQEEKPPRRLASKLAEVMGAVGVVIKHGRNDFHNYDYATEADVVATVRVELAKRQIVLLPEILSHQIVPIGGKGEMLTTLEMRFTFIDGDTSEELSRLWLGAGSDKGDKGAYKAMTGGEKYFLLKTFLIPTGDDPEKTDQADKEEPKTDKEEPKMAPLGQRPNAQPVQPAKAAVAPPGQRPNVQPPSKARPSDAPPSKAFDKAPAQNTRQGIFEPPPFTDEDVPPTLAPMNINRAGKRIDELPDSDIHGRLMNRAGKRVDTKPLTTDLDNSDIPF